MRSFDHFFVNVIFLFDRCAIENRAIHARSNVFIENIKKDSLILSIWRSDWSNDRANANVSNDIKVATYRSLQPHIDVKISNIF